MSKPKAKSKRKAHDWDAIERLYRVGQMSLAEIGLMHGVSKQLIHDRVKRYGWTQDLTGKVAVEARAALIRGKPDKQELDANLDEERAVKEAAEAIVQVVRGHRNSCAKLNRIVERLAGNLEAMLDEVEQDTPEKAKAEDRKQYRLDLDKATKSTAALAATLAKIIPLERQAFNVDGNRSDSDPDAELPPSIRERLAIYNS